MIKAYTYIKAGAIVPVTVETVRDLADFAKYYHDEYWDLLECVKTAINAGDWKVDGACDPDRHLSKYNLAGRKAENL